MASDACKEKSPPPTANNDHNTIYSKNNEDKNMLGGLNLI